MKIVLSPAKNLDYDTDTSQFDSSECAFLNDSQKLIKKLQKLKPAVISELMKISPALGELNHERYQNWALPFDKSLNKQAAFAFNGEAYNGLSASTMTNKQLEIAQKKLRILSGLYGLLKPLDLILPYRLEMGTRFATSPKVTNLYKFWGDKLTDFLNQEMKESGETTLINLASNEYFKALNTKKLDAEIYTPIFKDNSNGQYKTIMVYAKKARGMMTRFIIENDLNNPEDIKAFDSSGYAFNPQLSKEKEWVFTRG